MKKIVKKIKQASKLEKTAFGLLLTVVLGFIIFGSYHLTKFETIDEPLWKYDRIEKYYNGVREGLTEGRWKKTRPNDKPGVTVVLLSGLGLPFAPDPDTHQNLKAQNQYKIVDSDGDRKNAYSIYHTDQTEKINLAFRLPLLLFNGLIMLPLIFWLLVKIFPLKSLIPQISIVFIGLSPILIGMTQIINPDSLLWSFFTASLLAFFAFLETGERKFVIITGILVGFSLLSKYTASLLYLFFPLIFLLYWLFDKENKLLQKFSLNLFKRKWKLNGKYVFAYTAIVLISWLVICLFMPAVIQKPKHLLYATIYSPALQPIVDVFIDFFNLRSFLFTEKGDFMFPLAPFSLLIFVFLFIALPFGIIKFLNNKKDFLLKATVVFSRGLALTLLLLLLISLLNAWTDASFFPLKNIKEEALSGEKINFGQLKQINNPIWKAILGLAIQTQNFFFAMHPLVLILAAFLWGGFGIGKFKIAKPIVYFLLFIPYVFILGGIMGGIFLNVRYGIVLYPLYGILAAVSFSLMAKKYKIIDKLSKLKPGFKLSWPLVFIGLFIFLHLISLFLIKPFYFNYENFLLNKKFSVTDSWG
ncbi:MAG: hypothetical protein GF347_03250, partial [Candidatus Moranbacteria bacterium]|nr:hypothetical protein [Candidatus Moranbacteria bacterium]